MDAVKRQFTIDPSAPQSAANQSVDVAEDSDQQAVMDLADRWTEALETIKQQHLAIRKYRDEAAAYGLEAGPMQMVLQLGQQNPHDSGKQQLELMVRYAQQMGVEVDGLSQAQIAEVIQLYGDEQPVPHAAASVSAEQSSANPAIFKLSWGLFSRLAVGIAFAILAIKFI